jgi:osmoprotectant transport system ATP-binding protein
MVTHDLREAVRLAQRLVILEDGELVQHDTVENVLASPATPTVSELIASQLERQ